MRNSREHCLLQREQLKDRTMIFVAWVKNKDVTYDNEDAASVDILFLQCSSPNLSRLMKSWTNLWQ